MNDSFRLLEMPRRPWLDSDELQSRFLARCSQVHPDRVHNASADEKAAANIQFAALNSAFQTLRDPRLRLKHLLELERGEPLSQLEKLPSAATDNYFKLGSICTQADRFLSEQVKAGTTSPLLRVQLFERAMALREQVEHLLAPLEARRADLEAEVKALNHLWESGPGESHPPGPPAQALPLLRLEEIYRELSYLARWIEQLRARILQLTL